LIFSFTIFQSRIRMKSFTNCLGKSFVVELTLATGRSVKKATGVDLLNVDDPTAVTALSADYDKLADVLWAICGDRAEANGVSQDDFFGGLDGAALAAAWAALRDAYLDFCPSSRRQTLARTIAAQLAAVGAAAAVAVELLNGPETKAAIDRAIAETADEFRSRLATIGTK
jgi:hypothetical protein